jgi:hypothetical protein
VCATIAPEGTPTSPVPATNIDIAISTCPAGQVVFLQAGHFYLSSGIDFDAAVRAPWYGGYSHVTLRGAGADKTFLISTGGGGNCGVFICLGSGAANYPAAPDNTANWTAGYAKGTTTITLDNVANITPNTTIITLDQCEDGYSGTGCTTGTATDTGNIWVCELINVCSNIGGTGGNRPGRAQGQVVLVTACAAHTGTCASGTGPYTVTISPGLYMSNWRSGQTPGAWWADAVLTGSSVENLSVDVSSSSACCSISIGNAWGEWITGVRSIDPGSVHFQIGQGAHNTIQNSYLYGTKSATSESYGIEEVGASDDLFVNNIFDHVACNVCVDGFDEGSVYAYNYTWDGYYVASMNWLAGGLGVHSAGTSMLLFEGNIATNISGDDVHGTHNLLTLFRNMSFGADPAAPQRTSSTIAVEEPTGSRYFNVVGNVLGTPGYTGNYQDVYPGGCENCRNGAYFIGYGEISTAVPPDALGLTTILRWGNYDNVTGAVRWCGNSSDPGWSTTCGSTSEVPSTLSLYSNAVPSTTALPASFYLSSEPSWWVTPWGTPAWPPMGPDVTGGNIPNTAGHANYTPAALCYQNSPVDTSYQSDIAITGASWTSGVAKITATTSTWPEAYVTFAGINPSGYNGTYLLTAMSPNGSTITMSYALASNPGTYVSGGDLVYPFIKMFSASACYGGSVSTAAPNAPTGLVAVGPGQ